MILKKSFLFLSILALVACGEGGSTVKTNNPSSDGTLVNPNLLSKSTQILHRGVSQVNISFPNIGGALTSCSVTPALPLGLSLASDCSINGIAIVNKAEETYTVVGNNAVGSASTTVNISVVSLAPSISSNTTPIRISKNEPIVGSYIFNKGSPLTSCTVSPSLPIGLNLANDCSISGTATKNTSLITYTLTGSNTAGSSRVTIKMKVSEFVRVQGRITYDSVPFLRTTSAILDYGNITQKRVRGIVVEAVNGTGSIVGTAVTDANGEYSMNIEEGENVKIRISARLYSPVDSGKASWDFQIKDNTNGNALYVIEGSLASVGTNSIQTRNLNAPSGWGGSSYSSNRTAAPFAILDVVYDAIEKVTTAQSNAVFPALDIFWSKNNTTTNGKNSDGHIGTSHYDNTALYILGKENVDTDEYDAGVVAHEWGHYYEAKFSRSDSTGGPHGGTDLLDMRLAFGEGFGTAIGCMLIDSPLYQDSYAFRQSSTQVFSNIENGGSTTNAGWFNESSVFHILYDIYDSEDDAGDTLSLGFTPIHNILTGSQRNTAAFTSIFSFITALKAENPGNDAAINAITSNESIAPINDIYGTSITNRRSQNANPLYATLAVGGSTNIVTNYSAISKAANYTVLETRRTNELGIYNYVKFTIPSTRSYTISISKISGAGTPDPDFAIYKGSNNQPIAVAEAFGATDSVTTTLGAGTYRMDVIVYKQASNSTFRITLN